MNVSTSLNVFDAEIPFESAIRRCKAAGFGALDFNYCDYQPYLLRKSWNEEEVWAQDIRAAAESCEICFTQMHGPIHGHSFSDMMLGLNVESFLELAKRAIKTAGVLGIPWVVFHPGPISVAGEEAFTEVVGFNRRFYSRLLPVIESTGVGIALENLPFPSTDGNAEKWRRDGSFALPEQLVELIDSFAHPLVGACWDTGHGHISSLDQRSSLRMLGRRLKAVHIQDNDGAKDQHLLPYQGTIDWSKVTEGLRDIRYEGDFTYETHNAFRPLPDDLRDPCLSYAATLGNYLVGKWTLSREGEKRLLNG